MTLEVFHHLRALETSLAEHLATGMLSLQLSRPNHKARLAKYFAIDVLLHRFLEVDGKVV
jgi:hypothetical protein